MRTFTSKTIQQIRGLMILGGLTFLAVPFALMLSVTGFIVMLIGVGLLVAGVAWKRLQCIKIKMCKLQRGGQRWQGSQAKRKKNIS